MKSVSELLQCKFVPLALLFIGAIFPSSAWSMSEGLEEAIADVMVWIVVIVIPIGALYLFWKVHILPEMVAEKKQHPQKGAIQVLCLLSLVFGGLLWPIAWLWAYTKPTSYKLAYGTDKHDDFFRDPENGHSQKPLELAVVDDELSQLKAKLAGLEKKRDLIIAAQNNHPQEQQDA